MRIQINENECYELEVPEQVSKEDLYQLIDRLNKVVKLFPQDTFMATAKEKSVKVPGQRAPRKYTWAFMKNNERLQTEFLRLFDAEGINGERFVKLLKENGFAWDGTADCKKAIWQKQRKMRDE